MEQEKLQKFENWLRRMNKRELTIYSWLKQLEKFPDGFDFSDVNKINEWLDTNFPRSRDGKNSSFGSTYQLVATIRSYLRYIGKEDCVSKVKYPKGKMPRKLRILTDEQIEKLLSVIESIENSREKDTLRLMIRLLVENGMRRGEAYYLQPSWISWEENKITIPKQVAKGKQDRDVFFSDATKNLLKDYIEQYSIDYSHRLCNFGNSPAILYKHIKKIIKLAKLPEWVTPHTFRHTFASRLVRKNVNLRIIQDLLGHQNITSTEIYTHINKDELKKEAKKAFI